MSNICKSIGEFISQCCEKLQIQECLEFIFHPIFECFCNCNLGPLVDAFLKILGVFCFCFKNQKGCECLEKGCDNGCDNFFEKFLCLCSDECFLVKIVVQIFYIFGRLVECLFITFKDIFSFFPWDWENIQNCICCIPRELCSGHFEINYCLCCQPYGRNYVYCCFYHHVDYQTPGAHYDCRFCCYSRSYRQSKMKNTEDKK